MFHSGVDFAVYGSVTEDNYKEMRERFLKVNWSILAMWLL